MSVRLLFVSTAMMCPAIACAGNLDDKESRGCLLCELHLHFLFSGTLGFTERAVRRSQWALSHINSTKFDRGLALESSHREPRMRSGE